MYSLSVNKIKEIVNTDYAVERWMIDDLVKYTEPHIRTAIENNLSGQFWEEASTEGYDEGYAKCHNEVDDLIEELLSEGYDADTLNAVSRRM